MIMAFSSSQMYSTKSSKYLENYIEVTINT